LYNILHNYFLRWSNMSALIVNHSFIDEWLNITGNSQVPAQVGWHLIASISSGDLTIGGRLLLASPCGKVEFLTRHVCEILL
jgi:hypothetical protein